VIFHFSPSFEKIFWGKGTPQGVSFSFAKKTFKKYLKIVDKRKIMC